MRKALIVLPTYNEGGNIESLIKRIIVVTKELKLWKVEILIVDSNSTDNTAQIIKKLQKEYPNKIHLLETKKEGLGKAYIEGFKHALEKIHPYVIFEMDADWSHLPKYIPAFLKKIEKGADFVIGTRYVKGGSIPKNWGIERKLLSILGNQIIRWGFMKPKITDWTSGYRAIKVWVIRNNLNHLLNKTGYVFQIAMLDKALKNGAVIEQVPIEFKNRASGYSKINSLKYSYQTFSYVFTHSSFIKFVIVGVIGFIIDFSVAASLINFLHFPKANSNAISAEVAIISNFLLNNFWSFNHKKIEGKIATYLKKFIHFNLISSGSIFIQWLGLKLTLKIFGDTYISILSRQIPSWIIYKIIIIGTIIVPYSYILYNKVIWKKK